MDNNQQDFAWYNWTPKECVECRHEGIVWCTCGYRPVPHCRTCQITHELLHPQADHVIIPQNLELQRMDHFIEYQLSRQEVISLLNLSDPGEAEWLEGSAKIHFGYCWRAIWHPVATDTRYQQQQQLSNQIKCLLISFLLACCLLTAQNLGYLM